MAVVDAAVAAVTAVTAVFAGRDSDEVGKYDFDTDYNDMRHSLIYGEVDAAALVQLLARLVDRLRMRLPGGGAGPAGEGAAPSGASRTHAGLRFADVGSGEGLPCVAAAASGLFGAVTGVELVHVSDVRPP
jgi:hypothetical protein